MRGSFAAPLPILRQIFLCVVDSHRAVRYGGDHLPQRLGAHVAHGEHAGEAGAGGFVRHNIAGLVQRQLSSEQLRRRGASHADEHAVAGKVALRAGVDILQTKPRQTVFVQQRGDGAVHILTVRQKAALKIEDNRAGDSLSIIMINQKLGCMLPSIPATICATGRM